VSDHIIRWHKNVEDTVSHLDPVRKAVYGKATGMAREAGVALARHRRTGAAHINVTLSPPRKLDATVELHDADPGGGAPSKDRSAMSIEFGWTQTEDSKGNKLKAPIEHKGLHILGNVMNRAIGRARGK
jgi:hypothetical protein